MRRSLVILLLLTALLLAACDQGGPSGQAGPGDIPANAITINVIYAPESELYMPQTIVEFNASFARGVNPVTGQQLASGERPVYVTGRNASSGTVAEGIVNAFIAPNNRNVERPTVFAPSVSHWFALVNFQANRDVFDLANIVETARAPVVMAIWESRLKAIQDTVGYEDVGWEELLDVLNSENGWQDFGLPGARRQVYYGHTDPRVSSTALSTLIMEFYAAARDEGFTGRRLGLEQVRDETIQEGVRRIENLIRHYSSRTTEFKEYIAQGTDYLDFVALEENDLIYINQGKTEVKPPEKLVALYPKEGTFWHEHPMGIVNADWVTPEQREAARIFIDYVLTESVQRRIMDAGFRPVNPAVELGYPFVPENGVTAQGPKTVLDVPAPNVIAEIQQSWAYVKKQADVMLLIDVSGSMQSEGKLDQAKQAALAFIESMDTSNRVGLTIFSDRAREIVPLDKLETNLVNLRGSINSLQPEGGTELYLSSQQAIDAMSAVEDDRRIRAVVILSDGADTGDSGATLNDVTRAISASRESINPVIVIPVAYGSDADINALNSIARAAATRVQSGDPNNIQALLQLISSYF